MSCLTLGSLLIIFSFCCHSACADGFRNLQNGSILVQAGYLIELGCSYNKIKQPFIDDVIWWSRGNQDEQYTMIGNKTSKFTVSDERDGGVYTKKLIIENIQRSDANNYKCNATLSCTAMGGDLHTIQVIVEDKPKESICNAQAEPCHDIDETSENALAVLIYTSRRGIETFNLTTKTSASLIMTDPGVYAVTMDATYVYWSNSVLKESDLSGNQGIYRAFTNGTGEEMIAFIGIDNVRDIAVDWITGNIYFIDRYKGIGVCTNSGSYCTLLVKRMKRWIQGLALHPATGMMYWSDLYTHIFKSEMNGNSPVPMVTGDPFAPTGLAIDYLTSRLYWVDIRNSVIESINLDGTDRKTVVAIAENIPSITVFGSRLFWNDRITRSIYYCDKSTDQGNKTLLEADDVIDGMYIHDPALTTALPNPCSGNPCGEICLLAAGLSYTCACSPNRELKDDKKTCKRMENLNDQHLIVSAGGVLYDYHHGIMGKPHWERINDLHHFTDIYNSTDNNLSSDESRVIFDEFSSFFGDNGRLGGIAFDHLGHNLYSTNPQQKRIEITSLSTLQKTFIQFANEPGSILLIPERSIMIVTFRENDGCSVKRMTMTGSDEVILHYLSCKQVSLAYDAYGIRLIVTDDGGIIKSISLDPQKKNTTEVYASGRPVSLAMLGYDIFWTEKNTKKIFWTDTDSQTRHIRKKIGWSGFDVMIPTDVDVMHLIQTRPNYHWGEILPLHECRVNNGGCSHVCLVESVQSYVCRCPPDMALDADQKTCRLI